jgi:SLOG cluster2
VTPAQRPLAGRVVNLSISESDDSESLGYPSWQINRVTLQLVAALFGQGASLVFGHDWREDGVLEAVYGFARQVQPPIPLSAENAAAVDQPLLSNLLPWPDRPYLSERDLERLSSTLRVKSAGLPEELQTWAEEAMRVERKNDLYPYLRARGLTFLRHRLTDACDVRLCLGGHRGGFAGRYPGVVEEALLAVRSNKPLYLAGFLGGATGQVIDAIEGKRMPDDFCPAPPEDLYQRFSNGEFDNANDPDCVIDREAIWNEFVEAGVERLAAVNGLKVEENQALLHTPVIDQVVELVLIGLSRLDPEQWELHSLPKWPLW